MTRTLRRPVAVTENPSCVRTFDEQACTGRLTNLRSLVNLMTLLCTLCILCPPKLSVSLLRITPPLFDRLFSRVVLTLSRPGCDEVHIVFDLGGASLATVCTRADPFELPRLTMLTDLPLRVMNEMFPSVRIACRFCA